MIGQSVSDDIHPVLERARALAAGGEPLDAIDRLRELIAGSERLAERWAPIAMLCGQLDDHDAALAAARRLWEETPKSVPTAFILARALEAVGKSGEAAQVLQPAAAAGQLSLMELFRLSRMMMFAGRLDEARSLVRRLLEKDPWNPSLWQRYAQLVDFRPGDREIETLFRLQQRIEGEPHGPRAAAAWALAKAMVDCGDDKAATRVLDLAAGLRREVVHFEPATVDALSRATLEAIDRNELDSPPVDPQAGARVTFVLGPPRSGTTLVEQILSRHPEITGGGELGFFVTLRHGIGDCTRAPIESWRARQHLREPGADPWDAVRRRYFALAGERFGHGKRFTDKLLSNHLRLGVIRRAFPGARVVRVRRDPLDVAWSCWRADFGTDQPWQSHPAWIARYIAGYEALLNAWSERYPGWIVNVDYEHLVVEPDWEIAQLLSNCGLSDDPATRAPELSDRAVSTSSFAQVRQPIHARAVASARRFPKATQALRDALWAEGVAFRE